MNSFNILVIGGGIAGLTAAHELAKLGIKVELVEKESFLGGHAAQFTCKAVENCAKCGACIAEEKLNSVKKNGDIRIYTGAKISRMSVNSKIEYDIQSDSASHYSSADAVVIATGFDVFDPSNKPYGYGVFKNVITNFDLEKMLRAKGSVSNPSDGNFPGRIAFIQCVGSRDSKLGHLWCSKVCCASSLRMARLIKSKRPETSITFFYIDIQGSGKDFESLYSKAKEDFAMIRAIPGDIYKSDENRLKITYFDNFSKASVEDIFDMVVLSAAMIPGKGTREIMELSGMNSCDNDFTVSCEKKVSLNSNGIFIAGAAGGPLSITESIAQATKTAWDVVKYIKGAENLHVQGN